MNIRDSTVTSVFIANAAADRAWTHGYLIDALGLPPDQVTTSSGFRPGEPVIEEVQRAVRAADVTVVVLSEAFLADTWAEFAEMLTSYAGLARLGGRLVPLLLTDVDLPLRLAALVHIDFRDPDHWDDQAARLRTELGLPAPEDAALRCPYRGLLRFEESHALDFFGRADEIEALTLRVTHQALTIVIGPSGSGKSSLLHAGLVPALRRTAGTTVATLRPGGEPLTALGSVVGADLTEESDPSGIVAAMHAYRHLTGADRLVLVVDPFEELFAPSRGEMGALLQAFTSLRGTGSIAAVLSLRSEFYGRLQSCALWPLGPGEQFDLAPLRGAQLREVIVAPAHRVGAYVDPVLAERLWRDAAPEPGDAGALPLLEQALALLWDRRERRLLPLHAYERLGRAGGSGLAVAVAAHADGVVNGLSDGRDVARRILVRLVSSWRPPGEGDASTRSPLLRVQRRLDDLKVRDEDDKRFTDVLQRLVGARLVTASTTTDGAVVVDLSHESLLHGWPTLARWVEESSESEAARQQIEDRAADWRRHDTRADRLLQGQPLREAGSWAREHPGELSATAALYLAHGVRRRRARHSIWAAVVLVVAVLGAVLAVPWAHDLLRRRDAEALGPAVLLPAGIAVVDEVPRRVPVPALLFDRHEVSIAQYRLCVAADACTAPQERIPVYTTAPDDWPVVNVTANEAFAYCRWLGRRLPTVEEWERAARGLDGRPFPWGTGGPDASRANAAAADGSVAGGPVPVEDRRFAAGDTPEGIAHLIGNVEEWTSTEMIDTAEAQGREVGVWDGGPVGALAVVGGSYESVPVEAWVTAAVVPAAGYEALGFRCVQRAEG